MLAPSFEQAVGSIASVGPWTSSTYPERSTGPPQAISISDIVGGSHLTRTGKSSWEDGSEWTKSGMFDVDIVFSEPLALTTLVKRGLVEAAPHSIMPGLPAEYELWSRKHF